MSCYLFLCLILALGFKNIDGYNLTSGNHMEVIQPQLSDALTGNNTFSFTDLFSNIYISTSQLKGNDTCSLSCANINTVEKLNCLKEENSKDTQSLQVPEYCPAKPCHGRIHKCFIKNYEEFCELPPGGGRRYHWLLRNPTEDMRKNCPG
ncbi:GSCOCG00013525001-RA-CDS, partial [Cotesia congregata]